MTSTNINGKVWMFQSVYYCLHFREGLLIFGLSKVLAFNEILGALTLDGLPILTGGQNVPPEGGSLCRLLMA